MSVAHVIKHYKNDAILEAIHYFVSVVCCYNDAVFHCLWDITTFTVYVTVCDLDKSFSFDVIVEITGHLHAIFSEIQGLERFKTTSVDLPSVLWCCLLDSIFKVNEGHCFWCHLTGHMISC